MSDRVDTDVDFCREGKGWNQIEALVMTVGFFRVEYQQTPPSNDWRFTEQTRTANGMGNSITNQKDYENHLLKIWVLRMGKGKS